MVNHDHSEVNMLTPSNDLIDLKEESELVDEEEDNDE